MEIIDRNIIDKLRAGEKLDDNEIDDVMDFFR